jgi:hypothetical protein
MPISIENISEATELFNFVSTYELFKVSLQNSRSWGDNLLSLTKKLQLSPFYTRILTLELQENIAVCESAAKQALNLIDAVMASIEASKNPDNS